MINVNDWIISQHLNPAVVYIVFTAGLVVTTLLMWAGFSAHKGIPKKGAFWLTCLLWVYLLYMCFGEVEFWGRSAQELVKQARVTEDTIMSLKALGQMLLSATFLIFWIAAISGIFIVRDNRSRQGEQTE